MFKLPGKTQKKGAAPQSWHPDIKFPADCGYSGQFEEGESDEECGTERHLVALEGVVESVLGQRRKMEDTCTVIDYLGLEAPELEEQVNKAMSCGRNVSFYAVYDGHAGHRASGMLKKVLHEHILLNPLFHERKVEEALQDSFVAVDKAILEQGRIGKWKDGACAVAAVVVDDYMFVANCGDSECVLGRRRRKRSHIIPAESAVYPSVEERDHPDWLNMAPFPSPGHDAILVSKAHKTSDPEEQKRVLDAGGMITFGRLFGDLAVARAFGDSEYKMPLAAADYITVQPYVRQVPLDEYDEFIIMASDGIWDKITAQEAVDMVSQYLEQKVRSGRPVAFGRPPPGSRKAMDDVQTPPPSMEIDEEDKDDSDNEGEKEEKAAPVADKGKPSKKQMMQRMKGGGGGGGDLAAEKRLVKNKKTKFKNTEKLNQLSLEEIKSLKSQIAALLINEALERGSKDNCTAIVVFFQWEETVEM